MAQKHTSHQKSFLLTATKLLIRHKICRGINNLAGLGRTEEETQQGGAKLP